MASNVKNNDQMGETAHLKNIPPRTTKINNIWNLNKVVVMLIKWDNTMQKHTVRMPVTILAKSRGEKRKCNEIY